MDDTRDENSSRHGSEVVCLGTCEDEIPTDTRERLVSPPSGCNAQIEYVQSKYDFFAQTTTIKLSITVDRPLDEVVRALDPQSWSTCSPKYFKQTYISDRDEQPVSQPPPIGSDWQGLVFEDVAFPVAGFKVSQITNFLWYKSKSSVPPDGKGVVHRFDYGIDTNLLVDVLGVEFSPGLDIDDGSVTVESTPSGRWKVIGIKTVHFDLTPGLTTIVNTSAPLLFQKVLSEFAYDLVCCPGV